MASRKKRSSSEDRPLYPAPEEVRGDPFLLGFCVFHDVLRQISKSGLQPQDFLDLVQEGCKRLVENQAFVERCAAGAEDEVRAIAAKAASNALKKHVRDRRCRETPEENATLEELVQSRAVRSPVAKESGMTDSTRAFLEKLEALNPALFSVMASVGAGEVSKSRAARKLGISRQKLDRLLRNIRRMLQGKERPDLDRSLDGI
jgi:DNA-directed RNA polymerase specialized sigma24 family protein